MNRDHASNKGWNSPFISARLARLMWAVRNAESVQYVAVMRNLNPRGIRVDILTCEKKLGAKMFTRRHGGHDSSWIAIVNRDTKPLWKRLENCITSSGGAGHE